MNNFFTSQYSYIIVIFISLSYLKAYDQSYDHTHATLIYNYPSLENLTCRMR